jgi:hypothetical protein
MRRGTRLVVGAVAVVIGGSALACGGGDGEPLLDLFRKAGNSDQGYFLISPYADLTNLVVGGKIDWQISDYEGGSVGAAAKPREVTSSDAALMRIEGTSGAVVTTTGVGAGQAKVSFKGDADGDALKDSFSVKVIKPESLELGACLFSSTYVRGMPAYVGLTFVDASSQLGFGYGYYPLALLPGSDATINMDNRDPEFMRLDIAATAGESMEIVSELPNDGSALTLQFIDAAEITSVTPRPRDGNLAPNLPVTLDLDVFAGEQRVCAALEAKVTVQTPDTCRIFPGPQSAPTKEATVFMHGVRVEGLDGGGLCQIKILLLAAGLAAGIERELDYQIQVNAPSSSSGGDFD